MKSLQYLWAVFLTVMVFNSCQAQTSIAKTSSSNETDSLFKHYFAILDSAANANNADTIYHCCIGSISFMETNTKIPSDAPGTFAGKFYFTKNNLIKWHAWYEKYRGRKK
jgi:hypothetical protein